MGYVIEVLEFGFRDNCGLYCGTERYVDCGKKIPVTTKWSQQKPKVYKTRKNAEKAKQKLNEKYGVICSVKEYSEK